MTGPSTEDLYWIAKAKEGETSGFVGRRASEEILKGILPQGNSGGGTCGKMKEKES